jgi:multidrug resistance efflux pump
VEDFPALRLTRASRVTHMAAKILLVALVAAIVITILAPWQQTVSGTGSVVAFAPLDRRQVVEATVKGRIVRWGEGLSENAFVKEGDVVLEIQDVDSQLLSRLEQQRTITAAQVTAAKENLGALRRQSEANATIVEAYADQLAAFVDVQRQTVAAAEEYVGMAQSKLAAERQSLDAAKATLHQAHADYERQQQLHEEGLASQLKMQLAEQKYREAAAKEQQAISYVAAAESELRAKERERDSKEREAQAKVDSANAMLRKARGEVAKAESDAAKAEVELSKAEKELLDTEVKLARFSDARLVRAPRDGYVMKLVASQGTEYVKEGDALFELVPQTQQQAVQVWIDGNDAPLVQPGRHVRLQFEGWPAVQFSGWPSVAVGTFGGEVALVDATDDGQGKFRIVVVPDPNDAPWPAMPYLRQGVRANAWILLDEVRLGYEVWRRMNGFPPALKSRAMEAEGKLSKPPKIKV